MNRDFVLDLVFPAEEVAVIFEVVGLFLELTAARLEGQFGIRKFKAILLGLPGLGQCLLELTDVSRGMERLLFRFGALRRELLQVRFGGGPIAKWAQIGRRRQSATAKEANSRRDFFWTSKANLALSPIRFGSGATAGACPFHDSVAEQDGKA